MSFSSIHIQGNIISSEILDKIRSEEKFKHQSPEAFGLARTASLRDEIGLSWSLLRTHWHAYKQRLETLPKNDPGTSLTREKWITPLLTELGYMVGKQRAQMVNGKSYAISHAANNRALFPIHVMGYNDHLDKRREAGGPRLSPHALVQEYLNNTEHLYALVTNGRHLRLLRDATRLVRMSYLEFDLERMFEEELYADFSLMYRVLHVSRMPEAIDQGAEAYVEYYHQESMASGTRIREKLSEAVELSIKTLANGFLAHPKNTALVQLLDAEKLDATTYYTQQLRLIYRILFLIVLEERQLIFPDNLSEAQQRLRSIYFRCYSIERLRKFTESRIYVEADKYDLWEGLKTTFLLFEDGDYGSKLGIQPLGSGLFAPDALGNLSQQFLSNGDLIEVLTHLTTFVSEQGQLVRVNYSDLDVEEFGSVYEGLLEYDPKLEKTAGQWQFGFVAGQDRAASGAHYTPEELVKPLIKHSLDHVIADKLQAADPEAALLSITVCDVACGSGHILLSAARKIATELASLREGAEQPSPTYYRAAIRDVIRQCIYGVDLNPLAVELCKVALWLEAHNPHEPLNFLDHHIKNGNAILGLAHYQELEKGIANEAFKTLPGDDKEVATQHRKSNEQARKTTAQLTTYDLTQVNDQLQGLRKDFAAWVALPESTPAQIAAKEAAYQKLTTGPQWFRLKNLADLQVAQFFIAKTAANQGKLTTDAQYRTYLNAGSQILDQGASLAIAQQKRFFHWFLEFPQVFAQGGFDCVLGNPPFLGGQKLTGTYGHGFAAFIKYVYEVVGSVDLVTYFFRRIFQIIKQGGFQSLISTNTIAQGDARRGGLAVIAKKGGVINHAVKSMRWPGLAAVEVALVTICKGAWQKPLYLDQKEVPQITTYLDDQEALGDPFVLMANADKSFQGSVVLGKGFVMMPEEAQALINKDPKNKEVLFPYLNGQDINNNLDQSPSRWVINFFDWPERRYTSKEWEALSKKQQQEIKNRIKEGKSVLIAPPEFKGKVATDYPDCYAIILEKVKPERVKLKDNADGKRRKSYWWLYGRSPTTLYHTIAPLKKVLVINRHTKIVASEFLSNQFIYSEATVVFALDSFSGFCQINNSIHSSWAWKNSSTMGTGTLRYSGTDAFETFPFISTELDTLENIGKQYHDFRKNLMQLLQLGLTKTYNQFHNKDLVLEVEALEAKAFAKKYGKESGNLWSHLQKTDNACTWEEAVQGIVQLRALHQTMDEAVLEAYGWHQDSEQWGPAIALRHDFYEVDYLPENDRVRYTIHPEARKEVLKRLLLLNHQRYEEEIIQGLHKKKDVQAYYAQKDQEVPEGIVFSDGKSKKQVAKKATQKTKAPKTKAQKAKKAPPQQQSSLFEAPAEVAAPLKEATIGSRVTLKNTREDTQRRLVIVPTSDSAVVAGYEQLPIANPLALQLLNRKVGFRLSSEGKDYEIVSIE